MILKMVNLKFESGFWKKLRKFTKKEISIIEEKIFVFSKNPSNPKFRKHKLNWYKKPTYSIKLWYDLRWLYFTENFDEEWNIFYTFFDIWTHKEVYWE